MGSPTAPLDMALGDIESQTQGRLYFGRLYLIKEPY